MIETFIAKELRPKSEKILEYRIKIQKNSKTKTDIFIQSATWTLTSSIFLLNTPFFNFRGFFYVVHHL